MPPVSSSLLPFLLPSELGLFHRKIGHRGRKPICLVAAYQGELSGAQRRSSSGNTDALAFLRHLRHPNPAPGDHRAILFL